MQYARHKNDAILVRATKKRCNIGGVTFFSLESCTPLFLIHLSVGVMGSRHRSVSGSAGGVARHSARSQKSMQNGKIGGARNK
jgi:hypothetical protein